MYSSYAVAVVVCSIVFPILASVAVFLRFYARRMKALSLGADDWAITGALVSGRRTQVSQRIFSDDPSSASLSVFVYFHYMPPAEPGLARMKI